MARRRAISENLLYDPSFNALSIEAQNLFIRMLTRTDDFGILPADQWGMFNLKPSTLENIQSLVNEMEDVNLLEFFIYEEKPFFAFKRDRFDDYQSYLIKNRTRSEYLRLDKHAMEKGIPGNSGKFRQDGTVTHRKNKVGREERKEGEAVVTSERITYDGKSLHFPQAIMAEFVKDFGYDVVNRELPKMERWLQKNKPKKDYKRFVFNWLNNSGGSSGKQARSGGSTTGDDLRRSNDIAHKLIQKRTGNG